MKFIHSYRWENENLGTYMYINNPKGFGIGFGYVFYDDKVSKWCENWNVDKIKDIEIDGYGIKFIDNEYNSLSIVTNDIPTDFIAEFFMVK